MMRLLAAGAALALFALVVLTSRAPVAAALVGLGLAAAAIIWRWRWLATAATCVFLVVYAAALTIERMAPNLASALGLGLALVIFVEAVDLSARLRAATVEGGVVRSALARWLGLGAGVFVAAALTVTLAGSLAATLPDAAAPLLAAAGALGSVLIVASLVRRSP